MPKRIFLEIKYIIKGKNLRNYLNDFIYKLHRRYFKEQLFDRLIITSVFNYEKDYGQ